jgi:hypothetical protein
MPGSCLLGTGGPLSGVLAGHQVTRYLTKPPALAAQNELPSFDSCSPLRSRNNATPLSARGGADELVRCVGSPTSLPYVVAVASTVPQESFRSWWEQGPQSSGAVGPFFYQLLLHQPVRRWSGEEWLEWLQNRSFAHTHYCPINTPRE